jgi:hypothetical protein
MTKQKSFSIIRNKEEKVNIEFIDIIQTVISLVLIPIWKSIYDLKVLIANDYVTKNDCRAQNVKNEKDLRRIHERIDEVIM